MLTSQQKAEIAKLSPSVGMYMLMQKYVYDYEARLKKLEHDFSQRLQNMQQEALQTLQAVRSIQKGDKPVAGVDYHIPQDGKDADTPSKEELLELIEPLIPQVKDGITPTKEELLALIKPLIPPSQNRTLLVQDILSQLNLPEIPTPDAIVEMVLQRINERKLAIQDIEGLQNQLQTINRNINAVKQQKGGGGGGQSTPISQTFSGNGVTTAFTLTYNVASNGRAMWAFYNGQYLVPSTGFTLSGKTLTTLFTPTAGTFVDVLYFRK